MGVYLSGHARGMQVLQANGSSLTYAIVGGSGSAAAPAGALPPAPSQALAASGGATLLFSSDDELGALAITADPLRLVVQAFAANGTELYRYIS